MPNNESLGSSGEGLLDVLDGSGAPKPHGLIVIVSHIHLHLLLVMSVLLVGMVEAGSPKQAAAAVSPKQASAAVSPVLKLLDLRR